MTLYANKKRDRKSTFKKRNKAYLLRWNIKMKRSSNKLNHTKLEFYKILKIKESINYKLNLSAFINTFNILYLSFEVCKLECINLNKIFRNWFKESKHWIQSKKYIESTEYQRSVSLISQVKNYKHIKNT